MGYAYAAMSPTDRSAAYLNRRLPFRHAAINPVTFPPVKYLLIYRRIKNLITLDRNSLEAAGFEPASIPLSRYGFTNYATPPGEPPDAGRHNKTNLFII